MEERKMRTLLIEDFDEALDKLMDMAYEDTPCIGLVSRDMDNGAWTNTGMVNVLQLQKTLDEMDLDECDMVAVMLSRDDVEVTLSMDEGSSARVDVFGTPEACADFIGDMLR